MASICWQIVGCILLADFFTGFGHWFEDAYSVPTWPILGKLIAEPNINHHINPTEMSSTFWERNYYQLIPVCLFLLFLWWFSLLYWQVSLLMIATALGNETHAWCHRRTNNQFILFLQETGLVITPYNHNKHHKSPFNKSFCTITNIVNPILNRLYFWQTLEQIISLFGINPKRLTPERNFV